MKFGITKRDNSIKLADGFENSLVSMFDDFFNLESSNVFDGDFYPTIDVEEDKKGYLITAEISGMNQKDLDVNFENGILTISGKKENESKKEDKDCILSERSFGYFSRSFTLPKNIKSDEIKADYKNGLLVIDIPKSKVKEPKKININVN